jgi:hypothetical protein
VWIIDCPFCNGQHEHNASFLRLASPPCGTGVLYKIVGIAAYEQAET